MDTLTAFAIIGLSGFIYSSFHLSISLITLLNGNIASKKTKNRNTLTTKLSLAMTFGVIFTTCILLCATSFFLQINLSWQIIRIYWVVAISLSVATSLPVFLFYFKKGESTSTQTWIPRNFAKFLLERTKKTNHSAEAFSLGATSIISELIFLSSPLLTASTAIINLEPKMQFIGVVLFTTISCLPIFSICCFISGGTPISKIQIWREKHKKFLQITSGTMLIILAIFCYVATIMRWSIIK